MYNLTDKKSLFWRHGHPPIETGLMKLFDVDGRNVSKGGRDVKSEFLVILNPVAAGTGLGERALPLLSEMRRYIFPIVAILLLYYYATVSFPDEQIGRIIHHHLNRQTEAEGEHPPEPTQVE